MMWKVCLFIATYVNSQLSFIVVVEGNSVRTICSLIEAGVN